MPKIGAKINQVAKGKQREFNCAKAPFPWFGGKSKATPLVWQLLGDVHHYVEPFAGSLAVLLGRPHPCNRTYYSETVNDKDGLLVNFWRAIQFNPEETARHASWPVSEADKMARQIAALRWVVEEKNIERLQADATYYDPMIAGWWAYGVCCQIGAIKGSWTIDPLSGRLIKVKELEQRERVACDDIGVVQSRPHLSNNGQGVNRPQLREIGTITEHDFHPVVMPRLLTWFAWLQARLRHVRIVNGDWKRVCTKGAINTLSVKTKKDACAGIFLDPPYADTAKRSDALYREDSLSVAHEVRQWCLENGDNPKWRIVLAGFEGEHGDALVKAEWKEYEWFKTGFLTGGMGNVAGSGKYQQHRERLWASPACLIPTEGSE